MTMTGNLLKRRIAVARGLEPGDVVLKDCRIVDVYTQTIRTGDIVVADGVIAGVGGPYEGREVIEAHGAYAAPGLIESHIHIESSYVSPEEFGRLVVPLGKPQKRQPWTSASWCRRASRRRRSTTAEPCWKQPT